MKKKKVLKVLLLTLLVCTGMVMAMIIESGGMLSKAIAATGGGGSERADPGPAHYANFQFQRNFVPDPSQMRQWVSNIIQGQVDYRDGSLIFLDIENVEIYRLDFRDAFPTRYIGPNLDSSNAGTTAKETIEISVERIDYP